jgi:hypothetical protein
MVSVRHLFAFVWAPMISVALAWGCAGDPEADRAAKIDPSLPYVDASWNPSPGNPGRGGIDAGHDSSDGKTTRSNDGGEEVVESPLQPGDFLITEVMYNPAGTEPRSEWFEVRNTTASSRSLSGLEIHDGANRTHVIGAGVVIGPGEYAVLVRSRTAAVSSLVPPGVIAYEYGAGLADSAGIQLSNSMSGTVALHEGATIIARADYGGWFPASAGASIQLKSLTFAAGTEATSWCVSPKTWTAGADKGTPGAANNCPP